MTFCHAHRFCFVGLLLLAGPSGYLAAAIPQPYPPERYEPIWKHSPFTLSSAGEVENAGGLSDQYSLTAYTVGTVPMITILDKRSQQRMNVKLEPNTEGIRLVSVQPDADYKKVFATIQRGEESGRIQVDVARVMAQPPGQVPGQMPYPVPTAPGVYNVPTAPGVYNVPGAITQGTQMQPAGSGPPPARSEIYRPRRIRTPQPARTTPQTP